MYIGRRRNISDAVNAVPVKDGALVTSEENAKEDDVAIAKISNVDARRKEAIIVNSIMKILCRRLRCPLFCQLSSPLESIVHTT
jgi:hypothetical protein